MYKRKTLGMGGLSDPKKKKEEKSNLNQLDDSAYQSQQPEESQGSNSMQNDGTTSNLSGISSSTSSSDALITTTIRYPLPLPVATFNIERRMRFMFYARTCSAWVQKTGTTSFWWSKSNFFEIPQNHMSFYLPYAVANDLFSLSATKLKVKNCSWEIEKLTARTFNEINPAPSTVYYQTVGAVQPAYEILCNADIQPTFRKRMWGTKITDSGKTDNTSLKVQTACEMAESIPTNLPGIVWQEPGLSNAKLLGTVAEYSKHTTILEHNHQGYTHSPNFVKGWSRLVASTNPKGEDLEKNDPAPFDTADDWSLPITKYGGTQTSNQNFFYHPVGGDCKQRKFHYRMADGYYPNIRTSDNPDVFIRCRDELDASGSPIPLRIEMDIKTQMSVEIKYGQSEFSIADQDSVRSNEQTLELISNEAYSILDITGDIPDI